MIEDIPVADDMTRIWHESIAVKISALVLYAVVLVACVTAAVWLWNTDERLEREFAVKADRLAYLAAVGANRGERSAAELLALVTTRLPEYGFSSATVTRGAETARSGDAGSDTTAVVRSIPTGGGPPAILTLYHAPLREAVRSRRNTVFSVTGASALVFGFFLTGIILLFITRPINAIVSATRAATAGDLSVRLDPSSRDEFGVLSRFFNRMLERISEELEERKRAEEQLRRSHEFLRTVLDSLNDEVAIIDVSDFTIVDANVSFFTAYGYTRENIIKKTCHEITHHRDDVCSPPHDSCPLLETLRTGGYAAAEHIHVDRRGNRIYVEVSSSPIRDKNGRIVRIAHVSRDITERKKTEQALRESEERYQQLSEQLSQSNEELQEINQELKAFMYSAAHDLRQPLVNIQGFTSELRRSVGEVQTMFAAVADRCSPEERAQLARFFSENIMDSEVFIRASVDRMSSLINALLKLSQAGHRTLKPELLCMNALMRSLLAGFEQQIRKKNAKVTVGDLPDLVADRTAMEQIMGNLLDNAVKFLVPERPGRVEVSGAKTEGGITYHIRDNGCGISADDMPRLFHLFRRLGRQDTAGEGVGLAYTKALIKRHGGRIWCESEVGVGTTFSFAMPLADLTS